MMEALLAAMLGLREMARKRKLIPMVSTNNTDQLWMGILIIVFKPVASCGVSTVLLIL